MATQQKPSSFARKASPKPKTISSARAVLLRENLIIEVYRGGEYNQLIYLNSRLIDSSKQGFSLLPEKLANNAYIINACEKHGLSISTKLLTKYLTEIVSEFVQVLPQPPKPKPSPETLERGKRAINDLRQMLGGDK